ncbi:hypothetical protein IT087_00090 [Candidatus Uhrbacteria bacterium]|nr:hypothetical protein [Candidatus Uhrbacteria bacterium]
MPEGETSRSPRERLLPLILRMRPDFHSCITITRSLIHVFYNVRYIGMDVPWIECLDALKNEGVLYHEVFNSIVELFKERAEWQPFVRELRILQDMRPDHLVGPEDKVIWVSERPPRRRPPKPDPPAE